MLNTLEMNNRKYANALISGMLAADMVYYLVRKRVDSQNIKNKLLDNILDFSFI